MSKDKILNYFLAVVIGMWISILCIIPQRLKEIDKINQLKQENEKLTSIIVEINKE